MNFFFYAFLALFIWAFIAILEKVVLGTRGMNPFSYLAFTYLLGACVFPFLFWIPLSFPPLPYAVLLAITALWSFT